MISSRRNLTGIRQHGLRNRIHQQTGKTPTAGEQIAKNVLCVRVVVSSGLTKASAQVVSAASRWASSVFLAPDVPVIILSDATPILSGARLQSIPAVGKNLVPGLWPAGL